MTSASDSPDLPPPPPGGALPPPSRPAAGWPLPSDDADDGGTRSDALTARQPRVTVFDAAATVTLYFLAQLIVGFFVAALAALVGMPLSPTVWSFVAVAATVFGLMFALLWLHLRGRLASALSSPASTGMLTVAIGIGVGLGGGMLTYAINAGVGLVFTPDAPVEQQVIQDALAGGRAFVLALLVALVIAPVAEEVLFRGVLFRALRYRIGMWPAAVLSSAAFTGVHVEIVVSQPLALVGLFTFGLVLAWSMEKFQHLLVPILAHAVFNGISLSLVVILDRMGIVI
jgi:membrane protease YdiL (CAAX protease family)